MENVLTRKIVFYPMDKARGTVKGCLDSSVENGLGRCGAKSGDKVN